MEQLSKKPSTNFLEVLEEKFNSSAALKMKAQMMEKGARLMMSAEIWKNAIPTRHCDVLVTLPSRDLQESQEIVKWLMDQIRKKDRRLRYECHYHTQLDSYALYLTARYENLLRGAELLKLKKRLKDEFGGGLREFNYNDAKCFEGVNNKREFLTNQERALIIKNFLFSIRAQDNEENLPVYEKCKHLVLREGQAISKLFWNGCFFGPLGFYHAMPKGVSVYSSYSLKPHPMQVCFHERNNVLGKKMFSVTIGLVPTCTGNKTWSGTQIFVLVPALLSRGLIENVQPLHDREQLKPIQDWVTQSLELLSLDRIEKYFGTQISMYFAWLHHYTVALIFPAFIGLLLFWFGISTSDYDQKTGESQLASDICFVLFALFNCIWATLLLESWKRRQAELAYQWGTLGMEKDLLAEPRAMFQGEVARNEISGRLEPHYPVWRRQMISYIVSVPATVFCIFIMFCAMLAVFEFQEWTTEKFGDSSLLYFITFIPKILLAVLIILSDFAYTKFAVHLNDIENYRNEDTYENQLIMKIAIFQFVNSFLSLFYIGFYLKDMTRLRELAALLITRQVIGNCQEAVIPWIIDRVKLSQMAYKMTRKMSDASLEQHVSDIKEHARIEERKLHTKNSIELPDSPLLTPETERCQLSSCPEEIELRQRISCTKGDDERDTEISVPKSPHLSVSEYRGESGAQFTQAEVESMLAKYASPLEDYLEMFIQFGYVLLFSPAFPLAAVWALANNLFEVRVDTFKLTRTFQRPFGQRVQDIGSWMPAMELMGVVGVIVNCALIGQSGLVQRFWPDISWGGQILLVVVLEHLILALKFIISVAIPDIPNWVTVKMAKVEFKRREALRRETLMSSERQSVDSPPQDDWSFCPGKPVDFPESVSHSET